MAPAPISGHSSIGSLLMSFHQCCEPLVPHLFLSLIMLMNKSVIVICPRLMSPCICCYCLVSRAGVSRITQLKLSAFGPSTLPFCITIIFLYLSPSTLHPPPSDPPILSSIKSTFSLRWWADLLSMGNREIEMITLSFHSWMPSFPWVKHTHSLTNTHTNTARSF